MPYFLRTQEHNPARHPAMPTTYPFEYNEAPSIEDLIGVGWVEMTQGEYAAYLQFEQAKPAYATYLATIAAEEAQKEALKNAFKTLQERTDYGRKVRLGIVLQNQIEGISVAQSVGFLEKFSPIAALLDNGAFETAHATLSATAVDAPGGWFTALRKQFYLAIVEALQSQDYALLPGLEYSGPEGTMVFIGYAP